MEENRRFNWSDLFIKVILVIIFVLFTVWLLSLSNKKMTNSLDVLTDNIFAENIDKMKEVGESYFTIERLPEKVGEIEVLTLEKMYEKKLILELKDKNGNACSAKDSYVSIEKFDNEYINAVFEFIYKNDLLALPNGKTVIDGENVWVNRSSYVGKEKEECKIENHHNYLDLQLVIKGVEGIGYVHIDRNGVKEMAPYDSVKDKCNFVGDVDGIIYLHDGDFVLVWPEDLHQPQIKYNDEIIEKAVFKIKIK